MGGQPVVVWPLAGERDVEQPLELRGLHIDIAHVEQDDLVGPSASLEGRLAWGCVAYGLLDELPGDQDQLTGGGAGFGFSAISRGSPCGSPWPADAAGA